MNFPSLPKTQREWSTEAWPHKIKYRAFTAGQQSLFLAVADQNTPLEERAQTMASIFNECVDAGVPFERLPPAIVEKVFLLMRSISIGEIMPVRYRCSNTHENEECGQEVLLNIDLTKVDLVVPDGYTDTFELAGGYFLKMRVPSYFDLLRLPKMNIEDQIAACTAYLYREEDVWPIEDPNEPGLSTEVVANRRAALAEFTQWVADNLEADVLVNIANNFFSKQMHIYYKGGVKCPKCGFSHEIEIKSVNQVFI
uniref:Baseplate protein n=1 Tax=Serratia phage Kevin TaxID=3161161 RepID=A0AAU8L011_9CAUD